MKVIEIQQAVGIGDFDMKVIEIQKETIRTFMSQWPCSGIPRNCDHIVVAMDEGDLIDYDLLDADDSVLPRESYQDADGSGALSALFDDAWNDHYVVLDDPQMIAPILNY